MLITPATGYIALHEFHPEAFTAPFLLLMLHARLRCSLRAHWGWLIAVLACKENMALLIAAYCVVHVVLERKRPLAELRAWYLWPMALSVLWFLVCAKLITPALNSGSIDYLALYDRLGGIRGRYFAQRDHATAADLWSAPPIPLARKPALGAAPSLSGAPAS